MLSAIPVAITSIPAATYENPFAIVAILIFVVSKSSPVVVKAVPIELIASPTPEKTVFSVSPASLKLFLYLFKSSSYLLNFLSKSSDILPIASSVDSPALETACV